MKQSKRMALCGMMAALSVVILFLAGVMPVFVFAFPALAGLLLLPVCVETDWKWGLGVYVVTCTLALLLSPDRETVFYYICLFGHYPLTKLALERIRLRLLRVLAKLGVFAASVALSAGLVILVFGMDYLVTEFTFLGEIGLILLGVVGILVLFVYDFLLGRFAVIYLRRVQPKLKKLLH